MACSWFVSASNSIRCSSIASRFAAVRRSRSASDAIKVALSVSSRARSASASTPVSQSRPDSRAPSTTDRSSEVCSEWFSFSRCDTSSCIAASCVFEFGDPFSFGHALRGELADALVEHLGRGDLDVDLLAEFGDLLRGRREHPGAARRLRRRKRDDGRKVGLVLPIVGLQRFCGECHVSRACYRREVGRIMVNGMVNPAASARKWSRRRLPRGAFPLPISTGGRRA